MKTDNNLKLAIEANTNAVRHNNAVLGVSFDARGLRRLNADIVAFSAAMRRLEVAVERLVAQIKKTKPIT